MAMTPDQKADLAEEMALRKSIDTMQRSRIHMDKKHKFSGFYRYVNVQQKEMDEEEARVNQKADAALKQHVLEKEEKLAAELAKHKREDISEMKRRQILRDSPELRELEAKLKAAYTNKILLAQIREKEAEKLKDKMKDLEEDAKLVACRISIKEYRQRAAEAELKQKIEYKQELQNQMIFMERTKKFQYEQFLLEKKFIDEIVERIHEEDEREREAKYRHMLKTQEEIREFKQAQAEWKARARKEIEEEDRKIKQFIKEKIEKEQQKKAKKAGLEEIKARIGDEMAKAIYEERRNKADREQIITELNAEKDRTMNEKMEREKVEKRLRQRVESLAALHTQMRERKEREKDAAVEEEKYKQALIVQLENENRLELLSQEKKRLKRIQVRKDVEQMIILNRQKKAEEMQEIIKWDENQKLAAQKRMAMIEQERRRMLQEHAANLIGHLPPGVIRADDAEHLGKEVYEKFQCARANTFSSR